MARDEMKNETNRGFLTAKDFSGGQHPYREFAVVVDILNVGDTEIRDVKLLAWYDKQMRLILEYINNSEKQISPSVSQSATLSGVNFPEICELLMTRIITSSSEKTKIRFLPKQQPVMMQFERNANTVEAVILDGPEIIWQDMEIEFKYHNLILVLKEFKNTHNLRKQSGALRSETIATGTLSIQKKSGGCIEPEFALKAIHLFRDFLTLVKGTHCGVGNIVGLSNENNIAFMYLGFTRSDQFITARGWCDQQVVKKLPEIFTMYCDTINNNEKSTGLMNAINFYRASNISRESSPEMALIASHAALETLVHDLLASEAGWSNSLLGNRISFHDKLRAAVNFVGLTSDPLEHLEKLQSRSNADSNIDAFELLSKFRNRIVHHGKPFEYTGSEIHEIWLLAQWICEILFFYNIGYRDEMNDRRHYQGWRGEFIGPVPLQ